MMRAFDDATGRPLSVTWAFAVQGAVGGWLIAEPFGESKLVQTLTIVTAT